MAYINGVVNGDGTHHLNTHSPHANGYDHNRHPDVVATPEVVAEILLSWHGLELLTCTSLQSLWAGYGQICQLTAKPKNDIADRLISALCSKDSQGEFRLILKVIIPPSGSQSTDEGHLRKLFSYEVEQFFYQEKAALLSDNVPVAKLIVSSTERPHDETSLPRGVRATIMTDLRPNFPIAPLTRRSVLESAQLESALQWLANFHGESWRHLPSSLDSFILPPLEEAEYQCINGNRTNLWLNGGYTYLATRRNEYDQLTQDLTSEWSDKLCCPIEALNNKTVAELAADVLIPKGRPFETYIHGDVKSENMFFNDSGTKVAFYDFQYVGLGLGACDIAKLFTCSVNADLLMTETERLQDVLPMTEGEQALLKGYWTMLCEFANRNGVDYTWDLFVRHWETALVDWCRFQASWGWWGNTQWLMARVKGILVQESWWDWILQQHGGTGKSQD